MDLVNQANALFVEESYREAIEKYTLALTSDGNLNHELRAMIYASRGASYLKLKQAAESIKVGKSFSSLF